MRNKILLKSFLAFGLFTLLINQKAICQDMNRFDSIDNEMNKVRADVDILKRIQISGYLQPQWQWTDSAGTASFAGGNFNPNVNNRFTLRRARVKATYNAEFSQYVFQIDVTERGIAVKDIYAKFTDPWSQSISLTAGSMNRPFGFEVPYSSSQRESPERGRMSQIIFPGERELGAMLTFQRPKTSTWNFLKIEAGLFNGTGTTVGDFDSKKDFIGNIGINKTTKSEKINYAIRASYYNGGARQGTSSIFKKGQDSLGVNGFIQNKDTSNFGAIGKREYVGLDAQVNIDGAIGLTSLRGEYITGQQPGVNNSTTSFSAQPTTDVYFRHLQGAYFYLLQNIMHSKNQLVLKYDFYDPNTDVKGDEIGKAVTASQNKNVKATNATDLAYSTIGIGWIYHWDTNVKIVAYYDIVKNETSKNLAGWTKDRKDNVFTLRLQYKF